MAKPTKYWLVADGKNRYLASTGDIFVTDMQLACRFLNKVAADSVVDRFKDKVKLSVLEVVSDPQTGQIDVAPQESETADIPETKEETGEQAT